MAFVAPVRKGITSRGIKSNFIEHGIPFTSVYRSQQSGNYVLELWEREHLAGVPESANELANKVKAAGFTVATHADGYAELTNRRRIVAVVTFKI